MHPLSPLQWRALINSQGVHVAVAGGVIKSPSEPSQERVGDGGGQRGADVGLAYSPPQGSSPLDLSIDLPVFFLFLTPYLVNDCTTGLHSGVSLAKISQCSGGRRRGGVKVAPSLSFGPLLFCFFHVRMMV